MLQFELNAHRAVTRVAAVVYRPQEVERLPEVVMSAVFADKKQQRVASIGMINVSLSSSRRITCCAL